MSTVEARSGGDGALVAVKRALSEDSAVDALVRERDALLDIQAGEPNAHTWLATVLDHGVDEQGRPWIALPWFERSLRGWLSDTAPAPEATVAALRRALTCVVALHASGSPSARVHRDLKPDNFLVGEAPLRVVLADLGTARAAEAGPRTTVAYTPRYAPAEQVLGRVGEDAVALDVHALGVMIYQAFAGTEPDSKGILAPYTAEGGRLVELAGRRNLERPERAERERLRALPLAELLHLPDMEALTARDEARFRNGVVDALAGALAEPDARALAEPLLQAVQRAVHPDPAERGSLAQLEAALAPLANALHTLGRPDPFTVPARPALPAPATAPLSVRDDDPIQRDPLAVAMVVVLALVLAAFLVRAALG